MTLYNPKEIYRNEHFRIYKEADDNVFRLDDYRDGFVMEFTSDDIPKIMKTFRRLEQLPSEYGEDTWCTRLAKYIHLRYSNNIECSFVKEYSIALKCVCLDTKRINKSFLSKKNISYLLNLYSVVNKRKENKDETSSSRKRA